MWTSLSDGSIAYETAYTINKVRVSWICTRQKATETMSSSSVLEQEEQ